MPTLQVALVGRVIRGHIRLCAAFICGSIAWQALPAYLSPAAHAVIAWDAGVFVFLALVSLLLISGSHHRIAQEAARTQEGEWTVFGLTIGAAAFSFIAVLSEYAGLKDAHGAMRDLHLLLVVATLLASWLMVHTTFALRYAHEFYSRDLGGQTFDGGLQFPSEQTPDYLDFIYFALVLGMTFQVSDVQITSRKMRRLATLHGFLSFLFSTIIIALSVNLAAGLV